MLRRWLSWLAAGMMLASASPARAQSFVVSNYATFTQAIASSNNVITNFLANSRVTVPRGVSLEVATNLIVDGGSNQVVFSGSNVTRIFHVHAGASLSLVSLQLYNGLSTAGGAIFNEGSLMLSNCVVAGNVATNTTGIPGTTGAKNGNGSNGGDGLGASGAGIYSKGPLAIYFSTFTNNTVNAGNGGNGGDGITTFTFGGDGGKGGNGGGANGGAIVALGASNVIYASLFERNECICGLGGAGGLAASGIFGGIGGSGGSGASGNGGAIYCAGKLWMGASFFQLNRVAAGASGPSGTTASGSEVNGSLGGMAQGGAIFLAAGASGSAISNCTMLGNFSQGGAGGGTASGSADISGNGGAAFGAAIASAGTIQVSYCTISTNFSTAGAGGVAQAGGNNGSAGPVAGAEVYASPGSIRLLGTILAGGRRGAAINASGGGDTGFNLSSDASGISQPTSLANRDPLLLATVAVVTTNFSLTTNGVFVTSSTSPTTNFVPPVTTNTMGTNSFTYPTITNFINLVTNLATILSPQSYSYDIILSYSYTNTSGAAQTNFTFTTNFLASNNGGPTPTLALSNASPAIGFIPGIPGISFPLTDQRLFLRVSPTAIGAYDPNAVSSLNTSVGATPNKYQILVVDPSSVIALPAEYDNVTNYTLTTLTNGETNLMFFDPFDKIFTNFLYTTNVTITQTSIGSPGVSTNNFATNIPVPSITGPSIVGLGLGASFIASVNTNVPGLGFQWQLNSTNLVDNAFFSGTTTSNLVLKNIQKTAAGDYTVIAGTTLAYAQTSAVLTVVVTNLGAVAFTAPAANVATRATFVTVRGTVTHADVVTNVTLWMTNLNDGSVVTVPTDLRFGRSTVATWSATVQPDAGTNVLAAQASDDRGFLSPIVTRKFFSIQRAPLSLSYAGDGVGAVAGARNGSLLNIGQTYTLVAHPNTRSLFGYWDVVTNGVSEIAHAENGTLRFLMEADTEITATFIPDEFLASLGTYNGLFYPMETNASGPIGFVSGFTLARTGAYSAKVFAWGFRTNHTITGVLNPNSAAATNSFVLGTNAFTLELQYTGSNITGSAIADGVSPLRLERAVRTNVSAQYTMLLEPLPDNAARGIGYGQMTDRLGAVALSGVLADGTAFSQSVGAASQGEVPLFVPLYTNTGVIAGWFFLNSGYQTNFFWIKPTNAGGLFPQGFTNLLAQENAVWKAPSARSDAINLPTGNAVVSFADGGLDAPLTFGVMPADRTFLVKTNSTVPTNYFLGTLNAKNGLFTARFGTPTATNNAAGVILQTPDLGDIGGGFFLGATNSGSMILTPGQ
ncbi:MAG TPA: choice-of-anchor Q domain-containing protein [Verrucomicrobiae bacterium]|nr:choice-of-anchor Q domain-containing protein [Verrucomicrobiae bacterium]